ncbi:uncharacterized protein TNCV_353961 [Trichonephila clavipes]|uniref:Uncharacterized protein n=1 Tax=Trichonephila clavipes TaxID=2585209 RepID=A0A8X6W0M3_TRICX|nr:uncharacterized protein TNCV_353961 [Trichonephila clavipes]
MSSKRSAILELFQQGKRPFVCLMYLDKQCQMQSALSKSLTMKVDIQEVWVKSSVNSSRDRKAIEKRVQKNPRVSMRQIALDMGIRDKPVRQIAKTKLGLKPYKLQKFSFSLKKTNSYGSRDSGNF